ncbi:RHG05 protein, partial [Jacana jacana]|nr:RHG05 protein [Jacana jacana]
DHNISLESMGVTVNAVAGALKAFFADLPDPLIPYSLHQELLETSIERTSCTEIVFTLLRPTFFLYSLKLTEQYDEISVIFFSKVSQQCKTNLMNADNLSICFWPTLMRPDFENREFLSTTKIHQSVIETFIQQCQFFF